MAIGDKNNTNADFWLNLAAEHIYNSADRRTASVEALKAVILWAFGIFSVGGFIVTLFGQLKDFDQQALVMFGIAFFLLTLAYYIASEAQFPKVEKFRLADPVVIANGYSNTVKSQAKIFTLASAVTGLGFFFLAVGILIQFKTIKMNSRPAVSATANRPVVKTGVEKRGDTTFVPTTIEWEKSQPVTLAFVKLSAKKETKDLQETPLFSRVFYTDTSGKLFFSYPLFKKDSVQTLVVRTTVTESSSKETTMEKTVSSKLVLTP